MTSHSTPTAFVPEARYQAMRYAAERHAPAPDLGTLERRSFETRGYYLDMLARGLVADVGDYFDTSVSPRRRVVGWEETADRMAEQVLAATEVEATS